MKKAFTLFLFYLVLSLFYSKSQAQHYESIFGKQSTSWVFEWHNSFIDTQDTIFVQKDTIVNNISYKKIIASTNNYLGGLLREDTIAGKVWYKSIHFYDGPNGLANPNDTIEHLAFDFSLNKGDTFDISNVFIGYPGGYPSSWNIVDSVYFLNGRKHIEFVGLYNPWGYTEPITLIEGIGSNLGIIWKHYEGRILGHYLLCTYKDGAKTSFTNKKHNGNCNIYTRVGVKENLVKNRIKVYPNPVQNYFQIEVPEGRQVKQVSIVNAAGQLAEQLQNPQPNQQVKIDKLPPGFYLVQLLFNDNSTSVLKLIKHL